MSHIKSQKIKMGANESSSTPPANDSVSFELVANNSTVSALVLYSIGALLGILANSMLIYAIQKKLGHFGQRPTFTLLVKYLGVLDLILCVMIPCDFIILTFVKNGPMYSLMTHPRNIALIFESVTLLMISIDRFIAVKFPLSSFWNVHQVNRTISITLCIFVLCDLSLIIPENYTVYWKLLSIFIQLFFYTFFLISMSLATLITYILLFVTYYRRTQMHLNSMKSVAVPLIATNRHRREEAKNEKMSPESFEEQPRVSNENECELMVLQPVENGGDDIIEGQRSAFLTVDKKSSNLREESFNSQKSSSSQRNSSSSFVPPEEPHMNRHYLRLARILILITLLYFISTIPHLVIGWNLVEFPGYGIYLIFYLNAMIDPFILICSDQKLSEDVRNTLKRCLTIGGSSIRPNNKNSR